MARRLAIELDFGAWRQPEMAVSLRDYHRAVRRNVASTLGGGPERELAALVFLMLFMGIAHIDTLDPSLVGNQAWGGGVEQALTALEVVVDGGRGHPGPPRDLPHGGPVAVSLFSPSEADPVARNALVAQAPRAP